MPRMPIRIAVGERVFLRKPAVRDREEYLALRRDSARFLGRWEPRPPARRTPSRQFTDWMASARDGRHEKLLICRLDDEAILGAINLNEIVRGPAQSAYLGYWIGVRHARQGYMTEALPLALVRRAGFRREGYSPRYLEIAGRWADHERWALLAEDWRPR